MKQFNQIRAGDRVTIRTQHGGMATGRAVMFNRETQCWLLNVGGRYGKPALASADNTIRAYHTAPDAFSSQAEIINGRGA